MLDLASLKAREMYGRNAVLSFAPARGWVVVVLDHDPEKSVRFPTTGVTVTDWEPTLALLIARMRRSAKAPAMGIADYRG